jgi:hypothetical protein
MIKKCALALTLLSSQAAVADDYFSLPENWNQGAAKPWLLASSDAAPTSPAMELSNHEFEERMVTANKVHKYLGIGSIGAAALTLLAPKEENGAHEALGKTAATLGVGAVITGFLFHWDDINLGNGMSDPDNLHLALTTLGTLGYLAAVSEAPDTHGGVGGLGAVSMAIGIKMVW